MIRSWFRKSLPRKPVPAPLGSTRLRRSLPHLERLEDRLAPATTAQINTAIDNGLAWLASQQNATTGQIGTLNPIADTAQAIQAMEIKGNFPGGGQQYSTVVEKGLNFLFNQAVRITLSVQTHGDPNASTPPSDGFGIRIARDFVANYEEGIVMAAIAASNSPARVVAVGPSFIMGLTYKQVLTDMVDYYAWGQIDASINNTTDQGEGAWTYTPEDSNAADGGRHTGDGSVTQWPALGMLAAEQAPWNILAPAFVKPELNKWVTFNQGPDGGATYNGPGDFIGENVAKTGGLLVQFKFLGDTAATPRDLLALSYLNNHWNEVANNTWYGNYGHPYAMFACFKGLELIGYPTVANAGATPDSAAGDWYGSYADYLANPTSTVHGELTRHQNANGSWNPYTNWDQVLSTAWYTDILQKTVFNPPPMGVQVSATVFFPYRPNFVRPSMMVDGWVIATNQGADMTGDLKTTFRLPGVAILPLSATTTLHPAIGIDSTSGLPSITVPGLKRGQSVGLLCQYTYPPSMTLDGIRKDLRCDFTDPPGGGDSTTNPLLAPALLAPNGSTSDLTPTFTWAPVAGATHFTIWVNDLTMGQDKAFFDPRVSDTSWKPAGPLVPGHSYRWWVQALDDSGSASAWSAAQDFSIAPLAPPTLTGPGGSIGSTTPTFTWNPVPNADGYYIWISDLTTGQVVTDPHATRTSWAPASALVAGHNYRWWVQAWSRSGATSAWSAAQDFSMAPLAPPSLTGPAGSIGSTTPRFTWNPVANADGYYVWIGDLTTGTIVTDPNVRAVSWAPASALVPGHNYRWWVQAWAQSGAASAWSAGQDFSLAPLAVPTLTGPTGSITATNTTFTWSSVSGADHYYVWITDLTTGQVVTNFNVTTSSWATSVAQGHHYRWWVEAWSGSAANSGWGAGQDFDVV
jgi:hypothetical protein